MARRRIERTIREMAGQKYILGRSAGRSSPARVMTGTRSRRSPFLRGRTKSVVGSGFHLRPDVYGFNYVAFVIDAYNRPILGWRAAPLMTTDLVLHAVEHALFTRAHDAITNPHRLITHSASSQHSSAALTQRLIDEGVEPSVGSVGDALDNALAGPPWSRSTTRSSAANGPSATSTRSSWRPPNGSWGLTPNAPT